MHDMKKYFTEGLIQFTILLSLIGVRVDVDTYLNGYFSPLIETDGGPSSAFIQTPFHHYRDTAAGHQVHPKCPELDYYFTSRRLLNEVRALGSPARFPTRVSAWLVHLVPDDNPDVGEAHDLSGDSGNDALNDEIDTENVREEVEDDHGTGEGCVLSVSQDHANPRPRCSQELSKEDTLLNQEDEEEDVRDDEGQEETSPAPLNQLTQSSALEPEDLPGSSGSLPPPLAGLEFPPQWQDLLSGFDDIDPMVSQRISDLETDLPYPISYDVSLQDAMVTRRNSTICRPASLRAPLFRLESTNSSHSDHPQGSAGIPPASLFSISGNCSRNETSTSQMGGFLDEAVFEHINMLDLGDLGAVDPQMLDDMDTPWLEDSDSGLSLESSSRSAASPSTSSDSFCEEEGGATGYSSEVESFSSKGGACAATYQDWSPVTLNDHIWHDHTYSNPQAQNSTSSCWVPPIKTIKQEEMSEDEAEPEEMSRDERRVQALGLPFSAFQIIHMPVEEFLELLDRQDLSGSEVTFLRDVRRRGKNKLAAQNCRKRKLEAIMGLQGEVEGLTVQRDALLRQRAQTAKALSAAAERFDTLSRTVLSHLQDECGQPLRPEQYTLHCSANGRVVVQPRTSTTSGTTVTSGKTTKRKKSKKH